MRRSSGWPARRSGLLLPGRFRVWGLGFRVWGLGFRVWGLGFRVNALEVRGLVSGYGVQDLEFRVRDLWFKGRGFTLKIQIAKCG